jgi:hypothetical protein
MQLDHVAFDICERDVVPFYLELLQGKMIRSFQLSQVDAGFLFQIDKPTTVYLVDYGSFMIELFVSDCSKNGSFHHLCLQVEKADELAALAKEKGYAVNDRKGKNGITYFLYDSNHNIVEIKTKRNDEKK